MSSLAGRFAAILVSIGVGVSIAVIAITNVPSLESAAERVLPQATATSEAGGTTKAVADVVVVPKKWSKTACAKAVKKHPIYHPLGVTIYCVSKNDPNLHGMQGYNHTTYTTTTVWISVSASRPLSLVAHEYSHAFGWQMLTQSLRDEFMARLGKSAWDDGTYGARPTEVWAYNLGRCHGYPLNVKYTRVKCSVIKDFEKRAKAARG